MRKLAYKVAIAQVWRLLTGARTPAYGIPPYLWEQNEDSSVNHYYTLLNYLEWVRRIR